MAQKKISQLPADASPTTTDSIPTYDVETSLTKRALISDLITLFFNNIPTGAHSDVTRGGETIYDHVASGGVWTGDSYAVNKNASMTAAVCYINGRRISISAVTARVFTASKDTYIDVLDNLDGTGTLVYTEAANNAASPALASNSIRIGIIVTGATTIAAAGSVNQGQETMLLPIVSSTPYAVTDSLGNLICSRDASRRTLGYRQSSTSQGSVTTVVILSTLTLSVNVPAGGRKVHIELMVPEFGSSAIARLIISIYNSATVTGSPINQSRNLVAVAGTTTAGMVSHEHTPAAGVQSYCAAILCDAGNGLTTLTSTQLAELKVKLA